MRDERKYDWDEYEDYKNRLDEIALDLEIEFLGEYWHQDRSVAEAWERLCHDHLDDVAMPVEVVAELKGYDRRETEFLEGKKLNKYLTALVLRRQSWKNEVGIA